MLHLVRQRIKEYRKIEYLLTKYDYIELDDKCKVAIELGLYDQVKKWFDDKLNSELDSLKLSDLRERAISLKIHPIWGVPKSTLILAILEKLK